METLIKLGATDLNITFNQDALIIGVTFKLNGIDMKCQFDLEEVNLYAFSIAANLGVESLEALVKGAE